ncbi:MAG: glucose 1-dehydrogenase [Gammaproteobacteria bacterium]|nr:glucose 1-dehydrogenase [Gammaproteobacteria bacterium]
MERLSNKVAIITGSGSGMGAQEAILFAQEGASVIVADRDEAKGKVIVRTIRDAGGTALFIQHDVTQEQSWQDLMTQATQMFEKVDILVNNAAVFLEKTLEKTTVAEWEQMFDVNAKSVFLGCRQVIPVMRQNGGGVIVNVSSMFSLVGAAGMAAYIAAKGTIKIISKTLAAECAADNIRVNALLPGLIETPMVTGIMKAPDLHERFLSKILMRRAGKAEEIAKAALFLASDDSSYMTGAELVVDGGYTAI